MKLRKEILNPNELHQADLSYADRLALSITNRVGKMGFFIIIAFWTAGWLLWNTLAPPTYRFDPSPTFQIWLFISNLIQIMLMPLIMIGQNLQGRHAEIRAENDYQVNKKAEMEIIELNKKLDRLLQKIEKQSQLIQSKKSDR